MTKKIITICLALMLVLSVVGCSKEEEQKIEFPFTVGEVENGVKNGVLSSPTDGFEYFTSADIGWNWSYLNESYEVISVEESELPGNSKL